MTNEELNQKIESLDDRAEELSPPRLAKTGKIVPYIGWFWREVNFDPPAYVPMGRIPGKWTGIMVNNKWDHPSFSLAACSSARLREMLVDLVTDPSIEKAQAVFDFVQSTTPADVFQQEQWWLEDNR